jgi:copper(I)-binding protein
MGRVTLRQPPPVIKRRAVIVAPAVLILAGSSAAWAGDGVEVIRAWARSTAGRTTSAFATILNQSEAADRLLRVTSPVAERCVLRRARWRGSVMTLVDVPALDIPAKGRVELRPNAVRIALTLTRPVRNGDELPLVFIFDVAGRVETMAAVTNRQLGAPRAE